MILDRAGTTIENRFHLEHPLGTGGMSVVYLAEDLVLHRKVAVKILSPGSDTTAKRFEREVQLLAGIKSHYLPTIYSWGTCSDRSPYMVMELVSGITLDKALKENQLSKDELLEVFISACDGLSTIHQQGIIHRDLKPENIMVCKVSNQVDTKIMDLGIAHLAGAEQRLTLTNDVVGSYGYFSPEHFSPNLLDKRSDIFSLGCVMYKAFTGVLPFEAESPVAGLLRMKSGQYRPPAGDLPRFLKRSICKCLEPDPADRFQSMESLKTALMEEMSVRLTVHTPRSKSRGTALCAVLLTLLLMIMLQYKGRSVKELTDEPRTFRKQTTNKDQLLVNQAFVKQLGTEINRRNLDPLKNLTTLMTGRGDNKKISLTLSQADRSYLFRLLVGGAAIAAESGDWEFHDQILLSAKRLALTPAQEDEIAVAGLCNSFKRPAFMRTTLLADAQMMLQKKNLGTDEKRALNILLSRLSALNENFPEARAALCRAISLKPPLQADISRLSNDLAEMSAISMDPWVAIGDRKRTLLSRVDEYRALAGHGLQEALACSFLWSLYSVYQSTDDKTVSTLIANLAETALSHANSSSERTTYQLIASVTSPALLEGSRRDAVIRSLQSIAAGKSSNTRLTRQAISLIVSRIRIPPALLSSLLLNDPSAWANDEHTLVILSTLRLQKDARTLEYLLEKLSAASAIPEVRQLRDLTTVELAELLTAEGDQLQAEKIMKKFSGVEGGICGNSALSIASAYFNTQNNVSQLKRIWEFCQSNPVSEQLKVHVALLFAQALARTRNIELCNHLISDTMRTSLWLRPDFLLVILDIYRTSRDTEGLEKLSDLVWRHSATELSDERRLFIQADIAEALDSLGSTEAAARIIDRIQTMPRWYTESIVNRISREIFLQGDLERCLQLYRKLKTITKAPENSIAFAGVRTAILGARSPSKENDEIISEISKLKFDMTNVELLMAYTDLYETRRDERAMATLYSKVSEQPGESKIKNIIPVRLAFVLELQGRHDKAEEVLARISKKPSPDTFWYWMLIYQKRRDVSSIKKLIKEASSEIFFAEETRQIAELQLASLMLDEKMFAEADALLKDTEPAVFRDKKDGTLRQLEAVYLKKRDLPKLSKIYAVYADPKNNFAPECKASAAARFALNLSSLGQAEQASKMMKIAQASAAWPTTVESILITLQYYENAHDVGHLRELFNKIGTNQPELKMRAAAVLAGQLNNIGQQAESTKILTWINQHANWKTAAPEIVERVADVYIRRLDTAALLNLANQTANRSNRLLTRQKLALSLLLNGKKEEFQAVERSLESQLNSEWSDPIAHGLAAIYEDTSDLRALQNLYTKAQSHPDSAPSVASRYARVLIAHGKNDEAKHVMEDLISKGPKPLDRQTIHLIASVYAAIKAVPELEALVKAERNRPDGIYVQLAGILAMVLHQTHHEAPLTRLLAELKSDPIAYKDEAILSRLANIYHDRNDLRELKTVAQTAASLTGKNSPLTTSCNLKIAHLLNFQGDPVSKDFIDEDTVLRNHNFTDIELLGAIYFQRKDLFGLQRLLTAVAPGAVEQQAARAILGQYIARLLIAAGKSPEAITLLRNIQTELLTYGSISDDRIQQRLKEVCDVEAKAIKANSQGSLQGR